MEQKPSVVTVDCREHWQDSTPFTKKRYKHLPDCFSFSKDSRNSINLISISQSIKDSVNIYGRKGKEILSVKDGQNPKILQMPG